MMDDTSGGKRQRRSIFALVQLLLIIASKCPEIHPTQPFALLPNQLIRYLVPALFALQYRYYPHLHVPSYLTEPNLLPTRPPIGTFHPPASSSPPHLHASPRTNVDVHICQRYSTKPTPPVAYRSPKSTLSFQTTSSGQTMPLLFD